ncbi:hypothetical protein [Bradyrhizobium japonicum]|uniref:hypothetical protein n=2 Tax=Nitrobacteraceae TaxID=41294 RepID=UPI001BAD27E0|nr:hypothetical protein [Bradyrhizobium japonicum]MBR0760768.1 hypothetical protein [Bradyrhizobium japonicum]
MSRGPGRVERAICGLLESNPAGAFVVNDFAKVCFPGINRIEKKHRVSILRAANKVCNKLWWASESIGGQYGNCVFYNLLNLHSYAVGRVASHESGDWSAERNRCEVLDPSESERMLLGTDIQTRWRSARDESRLVRTDGPYPLAVEMWRARRGGDSARAEAMQTAFHNAVHVSVFKPKEIVGDIHPDFLCDCVAVSVAAQHDWPFSQVRRATGATP